MSEGYENTFLVRRALAFSDGSMDDARAILLADKLDEEEEQQEAAATTAQQQKQKQPEKSEPKTVTVDSNFDPSTIGVKSPAPAPAAPGSPPPPAKKEDVVFEATTAQIQELVIESPAPVLVDVHAEW